MLSPTARWVSAEGILGIQEAKLRRRHLVEQLLGQRAMTTRLVRPQVGHAAVGRPLDHVGIVLEELHAEQAIMMGRLLGRRDAQPGVIRIERLGHTAFLRLARPTI
jgi:hypothetical protein